MSFFPWKYACVSHVSVKASVLEVSESAILRIASRKFGIEPVVMDFILGRVTVGGRALPVKGMAWP
jgi:hypothetical protein